MLLLVYKSLVALRKAAGAAQEACAAPSNMGFLGCTVLPVTHQMLGYLNAP